MKKLLILLLVTSSTIAMADEEEYADQLRSDMQHEELMMDYKNQQRLYTEYEQSMKQYQ